MRRREFIAFVSSTAIAWPLAARAQQPTMPEIGFIREGSAESTARWVTGFHKGLNETGYVEGKKRDGQVPLAGRQLRIISKS
jgi:putative ABC transport system substrate-binding protein